MQKKRNRVHMHTTQEAAIRAVRHVKWFHHKSFDRFRDDEEVVFAAVQRERENFSHASDRLKGSKEFLLKLLENRIYCVDLASEDIRSDKDVALASRNFPNSMLSHLSDAMRDDVDVVEAAIQYNWDAFFSASPRLRADRCILLSALRRAPDYRLDIELFNGLIPTTLYGDFELMSEFMRRSPDKTVEFASEELRDNKTFGLLAVRLDGRALANLSLSLQEDADVVFAALHTRRRADRAISIPAKLMDDKSFVLSVLAVGRHGLECASERLRDDDEVAAAALCSNPSTTLVFASQRLKSDKRFVLNACRASSSAFRHANAQLRGLVGEKNPEAELIRLIDTEERYLALKRRLDAQYGSAVRTRSIQKV